MFEKEYPNNHNESYLNQVVSDDKLLFSAKTPELLAKWKQAFPFAFTKAANTISTFEDQKTEIIYQIFPAAFADGNGDQVGDLQGIKNKIAYLKELGITAIYFNPLNPSKSYHRYDVIDYYEIDKRLGNKEEFFALCRLLQKENIKVYLDFVPNHTSNLNKLFLRWKKLVAEVQKDSHKTVALKDNFYRGVQSDFHQNTKGEYVSKNKTYFHIKGTPLFKKDLKRYQVNGYYSSFQTKTMPDVNMRNTQMVQYMIDAAKYWVGQDFINGLRIDAVPHLFDGRGEDTLLKNWSDSNALSAAFYRYFASHVKAVNKEVYIIGETIRKASEIGIFLTAHDAFNFPSFKTRTKIFAKTARFLDNQKQPAVRLAKNAAIFYDQYVEDLNDNYKFYNKDIKRVSSISSNHDFDRLAHSIAQEDTLTSEKLVALSFAMQFSLPDKPYIYAGDEFGLLGGRLESDVSDILRRAPLPWEEGEVKYCGDAKKTPYPFKRLGKRVIGDYKTVEIAKKHLIFKTVQNLIKFRKSNNFFQDHTISSLNSKIKKFLKYNENVIALQYSSSHDNYYIFNNLSSLEYDLILLLKELQIIPQRINLMQSNPEWVTFRKDQKVHIPGFETLVIHEIKLETEI